MVGSRVTAGLVLGLGVTWASAVPVAVTNPGFEDISGESVYNEFTFGPLNGWNLYDPSTITNGGAGPAFFIGTLAPTASTFFTSGAPEGNRVGIAFGFEGSAGIGAEYGLVQQLAATLQPNMTYTLSVEVGNIASGTAIDATVYDLNGFPGYRIDLLAGGQVLASNPTASIPEGEFATRDVEFSTGATHAQLGQPIFIRLVNLNVVDPSFPNADLEVDFDDVRLDATPVPEPAVVAIAGSVAMLLCNRRRTMPPR